MRCVEKEKEAVYTNTKSTSIHMVETRTWMYFCRHRVCAHTLQRTTSRFRH